MKYLKLFIFIILFCGYTIGSFLSIRKSNRELNPKVKWDNEVRSRLFFHKGSIESINTLLNKNIRNKEFMSKNPNVMYTAKKCMYADIASNIYQLFYEYFSSCTQLHDEANPSHNDENVKSCITHGVNSFYTSKSSIVEIIFNLFKESDVNPVLKTSDQKLLKTLLSINLFMYYAENAKPFIVYQDTNENNKIKYIDTQKTINAVLNLTKTITQIINLIEYFRCKNCFIEDPYDFKMNIKKQLRELNKNDNSNKYDIEKIVKFLDSNLNNLRSMIIRKKRHVRYDKKMYDTDHLLFGSLLDKEKYFGTAIIGVDETLRSIHDRVKQNFNIVEVFKYQSLLLKVIANMFYTKILYHVENSLQFNIFPKLLNSINLFIEKIMPNNCLSNIYQPIISVRNLLELAINENKKKEDIHNFDKLREKLRSTIDITWSSSNEESIGKTNDIMSLVQNYGEKSQFKIFSQVVKLLSYESSTNSDYIIVYNAHQNLEQNEEQQLPEIQQESDKWYDLLRYNLFLFRLWLTKGYGYTPRNDGRSLLYMHSYIAGLKNKYSNNDTFLKWLMPLHINFRFILEVYLGGQISRFDLDKLHHASFLVISAIESYELKAVTSPKYNFDIFSEVTSQESPWFEPNGTLNLQKINDTFETIAENDIISNENFVSDSLKIYNKYLYDDFSGDNDREIRLFWNGEEKFGFEIVSNMKQSVMDFNDLIRYEWFVIRFYVYKFLVKMKGLLEIKKNHIHMAEYKTSVIPSLMHVSLLDLPSSVSNFLVSTTNLLIDAMEELVEINLPSKLNVGKQIVDQKTKELGLFAKADISGDLNFNNDIKRFKEFLNRFSDNPNVAVVFDYMPLSDALPPT